MKRLIITALVIAAMLCSLPAFGGSITLLHEFAGEFAGGEDDGCRPHRGSLALSGSTLYGTTEVGGDYNDGVVYKLNTDGSGFGLLHEFEGGGDDGKVPYGSVILSGSTLYGTTGLGGDNDVGVVFKVNTDGTGFGLLHEFAGGAGDGRHPSAPLTLSGSTLYGTTSYGGDSDYGTVFKVNTDGSGFDLLHEFAGGTDDGRWPPGSLVLSGSTLYGMTEGGGDYGEGVVFKINTDGNGYGLLHEFAGGVDDGADTYGTFTFSGSTLYGTTDFGGDNNGGVVFSMVIPEPSTLLLLAPALLGFAGMVLQRRK